MMENTWSKKPYTSLHSSRAGRKDISEKYKTSKQTLFEQRDSRRNIKSDPIVVIHSICCNTR